MKKTIFAIFSVILVAVLAFFLIVGAKKPGNNEFSIITSNFIGYDFARAVTKNTEDTGANVEILIKPGADIHSFEPTPEDIIKIKQADLFIYNGGESDEWVTDLLADNEISPDKTLRLMDVVDLKEEEITASMTASEESADNGEGDEAEYDEHIWTSIPNSIKLVEAIEAKLSALNPAQAPAYQQNANAYITELQAVDQQIRDLVQNAKRQELIFADRFPFRYFADEYGLKYSAAFPGCAEQTEASSQTVAYLIDRIKSQNIPVVLKIELSTGQLADTIAEATGAKVLTLHSAHNISADDFAKNTTYTDLLRQNLATLNEALN